MRRGDIWWADLPEPIGYRPVVLLSRNAAYSSRDSVTVAHVTTRVRGIRAEVALGPNEGLRRSSVANLDSIYTVPIRSLNSLAGSLSAAKMREVEEALRFALDLPRFAL